MVEVIIYIGTFSTVVYLLILLYLMIGMMRTRVELVDAEPFISIIVAAHNEGENIKNCLDSLMNLDYPFEKIEIIIDGVAPYRVQNTLVDMTIGILPDDPDDYWTERTGYYNSTTERMHFYIYYVRIQDILHRMFSV